MIRFREDQKWRAMLVVEHWANYGMIDTFLATETKSMLAGIPSED